MGVCVIGLFSMYMLVVVVLLGHSAATAVDGFSMEASFNLSYAGL